MSGNAYLAELETLFLALADKTRLRLLNLMRREEVCVGFFTEILGVSQPKVSRHLAYLRSAGLVNVRRDGRWMHYSIAMPEDPFAARIVEDLLDGLAAQDQMRREHETLGGGKSFFDTRMPARGIPEPIAANRPEREILREEPMETFLL